MCLPNNISEEEKKQVTMLKGRRKMKTRFLNKNAR